MKAGLYFKLLKDPTPDQIAQMNEIEYRVARVLKNIKNLNTFKFNISDHFFYGVILKEFKVDIKI